MQTELMFLCELLEFVVRIFSQIKTIKSRWYPGDCDVVPISVSFWRWIYFTDPLTERPRALQWRHNDRDGVSNHQLRLFTQPFIQARSKKTSKLRVTGLSVGNSPVNGEFHAQMASNAENVSTWWCHHDMLPIFQCIFVIERFCMLF